MTRQILLVFLGFYQRWLSPAVHVLSPWGCRYRPTCSEYAVEAVTLHGAARGGWMAMRRLLRCHPFARSGFDPVPLPATIAPYKGDGAATPHLHDPLP